MKQRYEIEGVQRAEELEMSKLKLQARLSEGQNRIDNLNGKQIQLEKAKERLQTELAAMNVKLDQAQMLNASMEKRAKQFDRIVGEWKNKVSGLSMDLDVSQKETRNASSELFRVKHAYEIKDIMDQIPEGGRTRTSPTRSRTSWTRS